MAQDLANRRGAENERHKDMQKAIAADKAMIDAADPQIKAIAVDDAYDDPRDMVRIEVQKSGLTALPGVLRFSELGFELLNYPYRKNPPVSKRLSSTSGTAKPFSRARVRKSIT